MSILFRLLLLPVTAPIDALNAIARVVRDQVDDELDNPEALRRQLADLQRSLEAGELTETDYEVLEHDLLDRLELLESGGDESA